ncbi:MAG TPA: DoxX family protein [Geomonas sp.]|nr:DoxX family protein [Geomonas sp.]
MKALFRTQDSWSMLIVRLGLGIVFFPHGAQKVLGWFGGHGFAATMGMFTDNMHVPAVFAVLAILAESAGSLGLLSGCLTRVAALGILCNMAVAVAMVHFPNGFFMNWTGKQAGEGFEYHILAIAMALALIIAGGGRWSVDRAIASRMKE